MAAHSLVTIPVVSHSHSRKKWLATGCSSSARCAWCRCRNTVTLTMVTWVSPSATRTLPHHGRSRMPENKIDASIELPPLGFGGFYVNPGKGQGHSARRGRPRFPDLLHGLAHPGDSLKKASDMPFGSSGIPHVCAPRRPG